MKINYFNLIILIAMLALISCSSKPVVKVVEKEVVRTVTVQDPGTQEYTWEPPMTDVVDVPPGLDPEGNYYIPSHQEIVEIRQGRWRYKDAQDYEKKVREQE